MRIAFLDENCHSEIYFGQGNLEQSENLFKDITNIIYGRCSNVA